MHDQKSSLRNIPQIDLLIGRATGDESLSRSDRAVVAEAVRQVVVEVRNRVASVSEHSGPDDVEEFFGGPAFVQRVRDVVGHTLRRRHLPVINATGILLHTGLGRAPLSEAAIEAIAEAARYSVVELDPDTGERDLREVRVAELLVELTGAEAATVVNNNAAGTMLALGALAAGKEVLVSRGELVEIGGGFRMPDVMRASGCHLLEVGSTNRTYARDYEQAIGSSTGLILKVHTSNYRVVGFTHAPSEAELAELAARHDLPYVYDLGSGLLRPVDLPPLTEEPSVQEAVRAGADLVTFSGDKLLCGPQAGLLVGRTRFVEQVRSHPLFRAMRPDKLQLAALEATLLAYRGAPDRLPDLPLYAALARSEADLRSFAEHLKSGLDKLEGVRAEIRATVGFLGSGSAPDRPIQGLSVSVRSTDLRPDQLADTLRRGVPRVFARVDGDALLLDMRTLFADELEPLFDALVTALTLSTPSAAESECRK